MKKLIFVLVAALLLVGISVALLLKHSTPSPTPQQRVTFPGSHLGTQGTSSSVGFFNSPDVIPDPNNPGYYDIQPPNGAPYSIRYIAETKYFNIALLQEPIGESRRKVEIYLMQLLGLTKEEMCSFNYAVYVPASLNSSFAGTNLGFSFCPGAVQLPD